MLSFCIFGVKPVAKFFIFGFADYNASGATVYKFSAGTLRTDSFVERDRVPLNAFVQPNPIKDKLRLTIEFKESDHVIIELYDAYGKLIEELKQDIINKAEIKRYEFDFPYGNGVYIINIHTNTGRQSIKVLK